MQINKGSLSTQDALLIYRSMVASRITDELEQEYTQRGEAFFHVSGAGHEGTAVLNATLTADDWLHCHYRDKALMMARGITPEMFFLSLFCKDGSHSRGRQMSAHLSDPARKVLSIVGPVGNAALQATGVAAEIKDQPSSPVVLCSMGDGMTQQGEVLEAVAQAVRDSLPVLFLIQDNNFAISTKTPGKTFYSYPDGDPDSFYGIPITTIDGSKPVEAADVFSAIVGKMRKDRKPAIVRFMVERLSNHTNADDQRVYRSAEEIARVKETHDPNAVMRASLIAGGVAAAELDKLEAQVRLEVRAQAEKAQRSPNPAACHDAKKPLTVQRSEYRGRNDAPDRLTMIEALREVLRHQLTTNPKVTLYGQDIDDPKGDVFGVTRGLGRQFGKRVENAPLTESTIVGHSIGRALAGGRPVAFLQFADFLPLAYNQLFCELGSMHWRTDGGWESPVVVMTTTGGYRPGLGPFHGSSVEAISAHIPGVDVLMPSTAGDAAGLLNAVFASGRPAIFFYPKNMLNDREQTTSADVADQYVPIGKARKVKEGKDITLVGYGNTVTLCRKAALALDEVGMSAEVIDLRTVYPWDSAAVIASAEKTGRLIIVHEDSRTAGMGAEIASTVAEKANRQVRIRRVTRPDTYVPCNFENQLEILPSFQRILEEACAMLDLELKWDKPPKAAEGTFLIPAIGASPSDESITITEWRVKPGDTIKSGQIIADIEADKAAAELAAPVSGEIKEILVGLQEMVKVGTPLAVVRTSEEVILKPLTQENPGKPIITRRSIMGQAAAAAKSAVSAVSSVFAQKPGVKEVPASFATGGLPGIAAIEKRLGSRIVSNEEISKTCTAWTPADIEKRTGIASRYWAAPGETAVSLAAEAARALLDREGLALTDLEAIICATGTPPMITPSLACLVHHELAHGDEALTVPAWDILAACSGYVYGLQAAYDLLQSRPAGRVLLLTSEVLSPNTDPTDPSTAPIFGDAATATLVVGRAHSERIKLELNRPALSASGESGDVLRVPAGKGHVFMDGPKVFLEAVKRMVELIRKACDEAEIDPAQLDVVVPHQANQRIIKAVQQKMHLSDDKVFSNIRNYGNTSSNTIPIALSELLPGLGSGKLVGLTAFGGGYTFAGAVLRTR